MWSTVKFYEYVDVNVTIGINYTSASDRMIKGGAYVAVLVLCLFVLTACY